MAESGALDLDVALSREGFRTQVCQTIPGNGITAISGPSGSGKTTLLRIIAGLESRATGRVAFGREIWQDLRRFVPSHKRRIGMVFQEPRLFPHLDVRDNLLYGARRGALRWADIAPVVAALDVEDLLDRHVGGLSGGEQRRVALARVIAMRPRLLCLDEPLTGLDGRRKTDLLPYLARAVARAGCPTLYVSHDGDEIAALADRVMHVENGTLARPGLSPVPDCFDFPVAAAGADWVEFDIGEDRVRIPGNGRVGVLRRLHIPAGGCLLSRDPLCATSGVAVFSGEINSVGTTETGGPVLEIDACGKVLTLFPDAARLRALGLRAGEKVCIAALQIALMPDRSDSDA